MRKWRGSRIPAAALGIACLLLSGCGAGETASGAEDVAANAEGADIGGAENAENGAEDSLGEGSGGSATADAEGYITESAADAEIDFAALKEKNPDIFGWLYIPGTDIDFPLLQSSQGDDYYETHDVSGALDDGGALYIELANLNSMCDFNTVIHGRSSEDETSGMFAQLYRFSDPAFFEEHEQAYVYLDGNVLTYEIFAVQERENTSLIRTYDFTYLDGCWQFLNDVYSVRQMGANLREGWENLTPANFILTLTPEKNNGDDSQLIVLAVLVKDAAGTVERVVYE